MVRVLRDLTIASAILAAPISALYTKNGPVLLLDEDNFEKELLHEKHASMIEFYAPWCGHCQKLSKTYEKVAKDLKGFAKVAAVNCEDEKSKPLCQKYKIKGFPTIKIARPNDTPGKRPQVKEYGGKRQARDMVKAVLDAIPNKGIVKLTDDNLDDWFKKDNSTTKVVFVTDKPAIPALYKVLAIDFPDLKFAQARSTEAEVMDRFTIDKPPKLLVLPGGDADGVVFTGLMNRAEVHPFIAGFSKHKEDSDVQDASEPTSDAAAADESKYPEPDYENIKWFIPALGDLASIQQHCFTTVSRTCVIAVSENAGLINREDLEGFQATHDLYRKKHPGTVRFYTVHPTNEAGAYVKKALGLKDGQYIAAVNGHRKWYKVYEGENKESAITDWLDAVRLGEVSKEKLSDEYLVEFKVEDQIMPEPEQKEEEKPKAKDEL